MFYMGHRLKRTIPLRAASSGLLRGIKTLQGVSDSDSDGCLATAFLKSSTVRFGNQAQHRYRGQCELIFTVSSDVYFQRISYNLV